MILIRTNSQDIWRNHKSNFTIFLLSDKYNLLDEEYRISLVAEASRKNIYEKFLFHKKLCEDPYYELISNNLIK